MKGKHYKLIGIINKLDVQPEFVYPVFEHNGKYFVQDNVDEFTIYSFEMLTDENEIKRIKKLSEFSVIYCKMRFYFTIGENKVIGFELEDNRLFLGDYEEFKESIGNLKQNNYYADIEVPYYIKTNDELLLKKAKMNI